MALKLLATRKRKENKAGNKETKAVFREQGTTKSKKIFLGNKGTEGKLCWEQGNMDPPTRPRLTIAYRKIPLISPGPIQLRKGFWVGL